MELVAVKTDDGKVVMFRFKTKEDAKSFVKVLKDNGYEYATASEIPLAKPKEG